MIRKPVVAGQFYPASPSQLKAMIEAMVSEKAVKEDVIGLVSPHAGYIYSGPVAGAVISRVKFKNTFIVMGPSHTGMGKTFSIMTEGTWKTVSNGLPIQFYNSWGLPMHLKPGNTWIVLSGDSSTFNETESGVWELRFDLP